MSSVCSEENLHLSFLSVFPCKQDKRTLLQVLKPWFKQAFVDMTSYHNQHYISKKPRFFQIILEDNEAVQEKKLWIPRRFVRIYGHDMSKYVQLMDPSGREWKLECSECNGDTWLKNGWQEFVEFYSLKRGHLLVFQYEGNSKFSVSIFDKSATEVMYPINGTHDFGDNLDGKLQETKNSESSDQLVIEISDDITPSPKKRKVNHSPRIYKTMRHNSQTKAAKLSCSAKENAGVSSGEKTGQLLRDRKSKAYERAKAFKSQNPFFTIVMQPSYINPAFPLHLPKSFSNDHFTRSEGNALLYAYEKCWGVRYYLEKHRSRASIGIGWKKFALENQLKVNDVCVFEMTNKINVTFKVHIYRADENAGPSLYSSC